MKRTIYLILITIFAISIFAVQKVAVLEVKEQDRDSRYLSRQIMRRNFFEPVFEDQETLEPISRKKIKKAAKGKNFNMLGIAGLKELAKELDADILVWGTVSTFGDDFKLLLKLFMTQTSKLDVINFTTYKKRSECQKSFKENLVPEILELTKSLEKDYSIALQEFKNKNYDSALNSFLKAIKVNPQKANAYYYISFIYYYKQDFQKAIEYAEKGLEYKPGNTSLIQIMAQAYKKMNNNQAALEQFEELNEIQETAKTWFSIAEIKKQEYDIEGAIEAYEEALELNPDMIEARKELYSLLYDEGEYEKVIEHLEILTKEFPDNDTYQKRLSTSYLKTDNLDQAIQNYKNIIESNPNNERAYLNLSFAYRSKQEFDKAVDILNDLVEVNPDNPKAYLRLADVYLATKKYDLAEKNALKAVNKMENDPDPYMLLSRIYQLKGYKKYEIYLQKDEDCQDLYGAEKDKKIEERDSAKHQAYELFVKAENNLNKAKAYAQNDPSILRDIKTRKSELKTLKEETEKGFLD